MCDIETEIIKYSTHHCDTYRDKDGKICNYIEEDPYYSLISADWTSPFFDDLFKESRLDYDKLDKYLNKKNGYALHISNLKIFKKPKELIDYKIDNTKKYGSFGWAFEEHEKYPSLQKAPQNMMRVYDPWEIDENGVGEAYVLISIRPEWICKILNGEKTIEVRKKVLKGMIDDNGQKQNN